MIISYKIFFFKKENMLKMDKLTGNDYRFAMLSKGLTVVRTNPNKELKDKQKDL